jgi:hypothetical protein
MTTTSGNTNTQESNSQLAADYTAKMKADIAAATALIAQLQTLFPQAQQLAATLAFLEQFLGPDFPITQEYQAQLNQVNAEMNGVETQLNTLGAGLSSFDTAITALENGTATVFADGDENTDEDLQIFANAFNKICQAMMQQLLTDEYGAKMSADGDDNAALEQDSIAAMKASAAENGTLNNLQGDIGQSLVLLNNQKNAAQTDLDSYHWWDDVLSFGTDEEAKEEDRAIIRNSNDMTTILLGVLSDLAPAMGSSQNEVYAVASLALGKLLDKLMKLLANTSLTPQQKGDQAKCLMALALGILAEVQTDAAKLKSQDQQREASAAQFATQMNISNEQAELAQLEEALKYASIMGTLMKIAQPLMEVAGMLLAPGVGSFLVMAALMIMDQAGLTDKLTGALSQLGLGDIGAEVLVGAFEIAATLGGGMVLDKALQKAETVVAAVVTAELASVTAKTIEETVQKILATAGKVGDRAAEEAVTKTVTEAVNQAIQTAAEKTVIQTSKQAAANLLPALKAASSQSIEGVTAKIVEEGLAQSASSYTVMLSKTAAPNALKAAEEAVSKAAKDIEFLAEAAAKGANITAAEIDAVANRASNEAIADLTGSTVKEVESSSAKQTNMNKFMSRVAAPAAYNAFSTGAISSFVSYELKKHGKKEDSDEFQQIMETIKIIESIMASLAVAGGTGLFSSVSTMALSGDATTLMKVGALAGMVSTGAQAISQAGQADAELEQADAVQAINESTVSNEMLNLFMQQFNQQGQIDQKNLANQMAEQASTYTMISQLENSGKEAAQVLSQSAV